MKNLDILRARAAYYEFLAMPFFYYKDSKKFDLWLKQCEYLAQNPLNDEAQKAFEILQKFDFREFELEQNSMLFDYSYLNVPLNVSFYEEGRDNGEARLRVIDILKQSGFSRNSEICKENEDFVGFVFLLMATLLNTEIKDISQEFSTDLFAKIINIFVDEFCDMLAKHEKAVFFMAYSSIAQGFFELERNILAIKAPAVNKNTESVATRAINLKPYKTKMPTPKSKIHWEEFGNL